MKFISGFLIGSLISLTLTIAYYNSIYPDIGPYKVPDQNYQSRDLQSFIECNEKKYPSGVSVLVAPTSMGYSVMFSREISEELKASILEEINQNMRKRENGGK